jgi:hypothetical protein
LKNKRSAQLQHQSAIFVTSTLLRCIARTSFLLRHDPLKILSAPQNDHAQIVSCTKSKDKRAAPSFRMSHLFESKFVALIARFSFLFLQTPTGSEGASPKKYFWNWS